MSDDVILRQNLPTRVGGSRLIAYNIGADQAILSTDGHRSTIRSGDEVSLAGETYRVAEVAPHDDDRPRHRPNGWVTLRRATS